jgi:hypothetical protein
MSSIGLGLQDLEAVGDSKEEAVVGLRDRSNKFQIKVRVQQGLQTHMRE